MTQIAKYVPNSLTRKDNEIVHALSGQKIKDVMKDELWETFKNTIEKCYLLIRYDVPKELQIIIDETTKQAVLNFPTLRQNEIEIAFTRGVFGEYGNDFKGLSIVTFIGFLKSYFNEKKRSDLLAASIPQEQAKIPTFDEVFDMAKGNALRALQEIKVGKTIWMYGSAVYDFLFGIKIIEVTSDEKKTFMDEGRHMLIIEYRKRVSVERDQFKAKLLSSLADALTNEFDDKERAKIVSRAKSLIVINFMQTVMFEEQDLDAMIEEKRETSKPVR